MMSNILKSILSLITAAATIGMLYVLRNDIPHRGVFSFVFLVILFTDIVIVKLDQDKRRRNRKRESDEK